MQIPILSGIYADSSADFRTALPRNLTPVPKDHGISAGYLRPGDGLALYATGQGADRGGIAWAGTCLRVSGEKLIRVNAGGTVDVLGSIAGSDMAAMDYSFERLGIVASGNFWYWDGSSLTQVTDPDLGTPHDVVWVDGYFVLCDDASVIVTELNAPASINPLKYGSSEADPDVIMRLLKVRGELTVVNRHSIEVFSNVGGNNFPFARNAGGLVTRGAIGRRAACVFEDAVAFVGSGRGEPPSVYLSGNGGSASIATQEVDSLLRGYTEAQLSECVVEGVSDKQHRRVMVHLPDRTLVYDIAASNALQQPVWYTLDSGGLVPQQYRARGHVWCHNRWIAGDPTGPGIASLTASEGHHYGSVVGWEFGVKMIYNDGKGAIVNELELVTLPGRVALGADPTIWASYSLDGETWSQERPLKAGKQGERSKRLAWRRMGSMELYRTQRFRGTSDAFVSIARLEAQLEPLNG